VIVSHDERGNIAITPRRSKSEISSRRFVVVVVEPTTTELAAPIDAIPNRRE
jgi:hypothetical protein